MASAKLTRTLSGNGNQNTATWSFWVKRSGLTDTRMYASWYDGNNQFWIMFSDNKFNVKLYQSSSYSVSVETNRLFRDTSAWYHIVVAIDTTQGTASDRVKIYVNGVQETSLNTTTYPSQNQSMPFGLATYNQRIGFRDAEEYLDGSISHYHFIDGTAYTPSTFAESDSTSGIWKPKTAPSVTYGTNGFFLKFENSGAMGTDSSGNSNTWTVGGTLTQNVDTPSNNFATWNPLDNYYPAMTLSYGNTRALTVTNKYTYTPTTLGMTSGKYYAEIKCVAKSSSQIEMIAGITSTSSASTTDELGHFANDYGYYSNTGEYRNNNTLSSYGNSWTQDDIIGIAVDLDNNKLYFSKNGTWQNSGNPESGATGTGAISITDPTSTPKGAYFFAVTNWSASSNATFDANFGQGYFGTTAVASAGTSPSGGGIFEYDCPSGYQALCTKGINSF
jgi:hypothetical protein